MSDRELVQLVCAFRLMFPDVGLVLSTREPPKLRNGLIPLGITLMSAGSHTEPGGYTGAGKEHIHHTERGRIVELASGASEWAPASRTGATHATGQFQIADERSAQEVAELIRQPRLRTGVEGLGRGADGVKGKRPAFNIQRQMTPRQHEMNSSTVIANGKPVERRLPCSIEEFLVAQELLPRSVVVEHNGEAVAPSEFRRRQLQAGDRLEIVKIVAGG